MKLGIFRDWTARLVALSALAGVHVAVAAAPGAAGERDGYRFLEGLEMASPINKGTLSRFNRIGNVEPGTYSVDVFLNGSFRYRRAIRFDAFEGRGVAACFKVQDLTGMDVRRDLVASLHDRDCALIDDIAPGARAVFDFSNLRLNVSVPQSQLNNAARGYIDPSLYDAGESIGFVSYSVSQYYSRTGNVGNSATYGFTNSGINLGLWRLRQQGSMRYDSQSGFAWNPLRTYAKRALPDWYSELTVGENFTSGSFLSGLGYQGISLSSDERMLPDSLRGYAPVIRGTARGNAQVIVSQKGRELYRTTVAPGPFVINDLYPTSYNGDLDVAVIEADGSRTSFSVPFSALPESMREGMHRYSVTLGRTRDTDAKDLFVDGIYQTGISNSLTGNVGARLARGYQSAVLGTAWSGKLGSVGLNLNYSRADTGRGRSTGWMYGMAYSRSFESTGTNFSIASYRYSTAGYRELADVQSERRAAVYGSSSLAESTSYQQHSRFDASVSQHLGSAGSVYLSGLTQNFYNNRSRITQMQVGYSTMLSNGISINLAFQRQQVDSAPSAGLMQVAAQQGSSLMLSVSIPLGSQNANRPVLSTSVARSGEQDVYQAQVSGMLEGDRDVSYSMGVNHAPGGAQDSINGNLGARLASASVNFNATKGQGYWQAAANARGAVAVHAGGITFGPYLSDTFALVEAKGAEGARLYNGQGAVIDARGFALVPSLSPYRRNMVGLSADGISSKTEIAESQRTVIPYAGATLKLAFKTREGNAMLIRLDRAGGYPVPMGADVLDEQGNVIGMVGQGSQAYLRSDQPSGKLLVRWGDGAGDRCSLDYDLQGMDTAKPLVRLQRQCIAVPHPVEFMPTTGPRQTVTGVNQ